MQRWGRCVTSHAWAVVSLGVIALIVSAILSSGVFAHLGRGGFTDPASESTQAQDIIDRVFPGAIADVIVVYTAEHSSAEDPAFAQAVTQALSRVPPQAVVAIRSPYANPNTPPVTGQPLVVNPGLINSDRSAARVEISLAGDTDTEKARHFTTITGPLQAQGLRTSIAGYPAVAEELNEQIPHDIKRAELITLPIVFALCLLIFGSVVAALMPTVVAALSIVGSLAVIRLLTQFTEISTFSANIITMLGMGLAVDYSLFIISRFREELPRRPDTSRPSVNTALVATMTTAGRTVLFSGLVVAASLAGLALFPQNFLVSMAYGGVSTVLLSMTCALTVLPATLALLGPRLDTGLLPWRRHASLQAATTAHRQPRTPSSDVWTLIARSVLRHPLVYLVGSTTVLVALALPFGSATWGSIDHRVLPPSAASFQATQTLENSFGGPNSSAFIVLQAASTAARNDYVQRLHLNVGQVQVTGLQQAEREGSSYDLISVRWKDTSQTQNSQEVIRSLRAVSPPPDTQMWITGASARTVDLIHSLGAHLPWMLTFVALVMLVLLFMAFGSVVLPVKAIAMNLISIAASFGVVTWIFQQGHLSGLLGFTPTGYLDATQPITMLAILFGLSMDYEVFLLSRMREQWQRTGNTNLAIATGLQRTGAIITSAALLLAVVIGGFTTSSITVVKMIGVGMLVAIILDATVVRALLVPSLMHVMGEANWWAPPTLKQWWQRHGHGRTDTPARGRSLYAPAAPVPATKASASVSVSAGKGKKITPSQARKKPPQKRAHPKKRG